MPDTDTLRGPFDTGPITQPGPVAEPARDPRFDNQPPLGERIMLEFEEDLEREGLIARAAELAAAAERVPPCDSTENAGKVGDFVKQCGAFEKALKVVHEKHNRPLIDARNALSGRSASIFMPIDKAVQSLRAALNKWGREEDARVARERAAAEAERKRLQDEADARASLPEYAVKVEAPKIEAPVARGDLGSRVGTTTRWKHEIECPIAKLPKEILEAEPVVDAINKYIATLVRNAKVRKIKGVRIYPDTGVVVR